MGLDTRWVERPEGDARPPGEIVADWIAEQKGRLAAGGSDSAR
jgi:hypothetical protein